MIFSRLYSISSSESSPAADAAVATDAAGAPDAAVASDAAGAPDAAVAFETADLPPRAEPHLPPLLQMIKGDLKEAIRARDKEQLSALRSVISACINSEKTPQRIRTNTQMVALLRRLMRDSETAELEAAEAKRADLVAKERAQRAVLESYVARSGIETMSDLQLLTTVEETVREVREQEGSEGVARTAVGGKSILGVVMKRLKLEMAAAGVDGRLLHGVIKRVIANSAPEKAKAAAEERRERLREEREEKNKARERKAERKAERMKMAMAAASKDK